MSSCFIQDRWDEDRVKFGRVHAQLQPDMDYSMTTLFQKFVTIFRHFIIFIMDFLKKYESKKIVNDKLKWLNPGKMSSAQSARLHFC